MTAAEVVAGELPKGALLLDCQQRGEWTDCYVTQIGKRVSHADFVEAFYTSRLFKVERWILGWAMAKPSTDRQAHELAAGRLDHFAAWRVERRAPDQLLMTDIRGRTRSWLQVVPGESPSDSTSLYFGSAIVPRTRQVSSTLSGNNDTPKALPPQTPTGLFGALLVFHDRYSRALLRAASRRLS